MTVNEALADLFDIWTQRPRERLGSMIHNATKFLRFSARYGINDKRLIALVAEGGPTQPREADQGEWVHHLRSIVESIRPIWNAKHTHRLGQMVPNAVRREAGSKELEHQRLSEINNEALVALMAR